jgi:hypothetical protein
LHQVTPIGRDQEGGGTGAGNAVRRQRLALAVRQKSPDDGALLGCDGCRESLLDKAGPIINVRARFRKPDLRADFLGKSFALNADFRI